MHDNLIKQQSSYRLTRLRERWNTINSFLKSQIENHKTTELRKACKNGMHNVVPLSVSTLQPDPVGKQTIYGMVKNFEDWKVRILQSQTGLG